MSATSHPTLPGGTSLTTFSLIVLLQAASLSSALEPPSKPFLDKNSFYLSSAGFKVHFASDAASKKAMHALPPHGFVIHKSAVVTFAISMPSRCTVFVSFIGTMDAYQSYRDILGPANTAAR